MSVDMDIHGYPWISISMDIHRKSVDMDMDMDVKFHIHSNPGKYGTGLYIALFPLWNSYQLPHNRHHATVGLYTE